MSSNALSLAALDAVVATLPDNGLSAARRASLDKLHKDGLPGLRDEDWKYTDLSSVVDITNAWLDSGGEAARPLEFRAPESIDAHWVRIANGQVDDASLANLPDGVSVERLSSAATNLAPAGRLGDLNIALLHDGLKISIADGTTLQKPVGILVFDEVDRAGVSQVRIDIEVGQGSHARFVEYQASGGEADLFSNSVINLAVAPGAQADHVRIQSRDRRHNQTSHMYVSVGRDSRFRHTSFDIGGNLVRNDLVVDITSPGAEAEFGGLYLVGDGQHIDNHTRVDHRVGPAVSRQEYRGILDGRARGVWNGKAIVHEGADGTDAEQANHNLLVSKKAEIDAKPELEIYADDVKCAHGTTVGQLDETALFYLRTRGLSRREARQMLTRAFAQASIDRTPIKQLHEYLENAVAAKLRELMHEDQQ